MNIIKNSLSSLTLITFLFAGNAFAGMDEDVFQLQKSWEKLKYQTPLAQQEKGFEELLTQSQKITSQYPGHAEPLIWEGIIEGTFASVRNGISGQIAALSLVKSAKKSFDEAIKLNPNALHGSTPIWFYKDCVSLVF